MNSKKKILTYLDFKGISVYKFEKKTGLSNGSLKSGKEFGVDKMLKIRDNYPDLNMEWLIYDEGEMIVKKEKSLQMAAEPQPTYNIDGFGIDSFLISLKKEVKQLRCDVDDLKLFHEIDGELEDSKKHKEFS